MLFFWWMAATTTERVVFHFYPLFCLNKCLFNLLPTENIAIKMLAKYLCCLILNCILRIYCDHITNTHLKKCLTNSLGVTRINKNNLRQILYTWSKCFNNFISLYNLKCAQNSSGIILKLKCTLACPMTNNMKDFWFEEFDKMFEILFGCDLAFNINVRFDWALI